MKLIELYGLMPQAYANAPNHRYNDLFGIELELEECSSEEPFGVWNSIRDGSLRNGREFVTLRPLGGPDLIEALDQFYKKGIRSTDSPRTSTHIHINATDMTVEELRSSLLIMAMVEESIFNIVDSSRKWAGYSMGINEMSTERLKGILGSNDLRTLTESIAPRRNQERYYGFNIAAFRKHGTIEMRYFPGNPTREELMRWLDFILVIKKLSKKYTCEQLSGMLDSAENVRAFIESEFNDYWSKAILDNNDCEVMLASFLSVSSLAAEPEEFRSTAAVVVLGEHFVSFVCNRLLKPEGAKYITALAKSCPVLTQQEWHEYLYKAQATVEKGARLPRRLNEREPGNIVAQWIEGHAARRGAEINVAAAEPDGEEW